MCGWDFSSHSEPAGVNWLEKSTQNFPQVKLLTYVVCIRVTDKRPDDVVQGHDDAVSTAPGTLEGVGEVVRLLDLQVAGKSHPPGDDDDEDDDQLDHTEQILKTETPLQRARVDEECSRDTGQPDKALIPSTRFNTGGRENVLAKHNTVASCPTQENHIRREHGGGQESRFPENIFEVVLLTAIPERHNILANYMVW